MCPRLYFESNDRLDWPLAHYSNRLLWRGPIERLMEGSKLRFDRLWLCKTESSKNCSAKVQMSNGNGAGCVTENARNETENDQI